MSSITLECSFDILLPQVNANAEKYFEYNINTKKDYPLTKQFLQKYVNDNKIFYPNLYSGIFRNSDDINCAARVFTFYTQSRGKLYEGGGTSAGKAGAGVEGGLLPLGFGNLFGIGALDWLLLLVIAYLILKD